MNKRIAINILLGLLGALIAISCVPTRKFKDADGKRIKCENENAKLNTDIQNLEAKNKELEAKQAELTKQVNNLDQDTTNLTASLVNLKKEYDKLNQMNNELMTQKAGNLKENNVLLSQLQATKEDLLKREDALNKLQQDLNVKEKNLNDLHKILNRKDSIVKALKNKVTDALLGFENKGLTIEQKNGKVYVSMEEALLFPSGSFTVNKRGIDALKKLASVLEVNPDINVLVEGHTDNVPYFSSGQLKDNWDLSVMRATAIVKIILQDPNIEAKRLTAAGESEYSPVADNSTPEGRAKNRRTEIILTPKLDELFKIIETN